MLKRTGLLALLLSTIGLAAIPQAAQAQESYYYPGGYPYVDRHDRNWDRHPMHDWEKRQRREWRAEERREREWRVQKEWRGRNYRGRDYDQRYYADPYRDFRCR